MIPAKLSLIVAASENGVIGRAGGLPWHLSADLRKFKALTMGHTMIMGRKTFESIGRLLPGRKTIILSSNPEFSVDGAVMARDWDEVWSNVADDAEPFIVGGETLYRQALAWCRRVYLTRVHTHLEGDAFFTLPDSGWTRIEAVPHPADERNEFAFTFEVHERSED